MNALLHGHGLVGWIVIGLIVGALAKLVTPGPNPSGCLATILVGIAGSLFAGWAGAHVFHWYTDGSTPGWIASIIDAVVLLALYRMIAARRY